MAARGGVGAFELVALANAVPPELWAPFVVLAFPFVAIAIFTILPLALPLLAMIFMARSFNRASDLRPPGAFDRQRERERHSGWYRF